MTQSGVTEFTVWDVQHGSAIYVATPGGQHIAIDLGTGSYGVGGKTFSPLLHLKNTCGVKQLDGLIITHPHRDHLNDMVNFQALPPRVLLRPSHLSEQDLRSANRTEDKEIIDKYLEINANYCAPVDPGQNPFAAGNNGGADFRTFAPRNCDRSNINNHSVVTVVTYEGNKMLIPGDNESPSWDELLESGDFLDAIKGTDVLVAPHHGRDSGFSKALFEYIEPWLTIISDGRFCDTSATDRYDKKTKGLTVFQRSSGSEKRKCVTTRKDGVIFVRFGRDSTDGKRFIGVVID